MNATTTEPTALVDAVPTELADLSRDGGGYHVRLYFLPDISAPEEACISILKGDGEPLDSFTIPFANEEGTPIWRDGYDHPSSYSHKLRDYLTPSKGEMAAN